MASVVKIGEKKDVVKTVLLSMCNLFQFPSSLMGLNSNQVGFYISDMFIVLL